MTTSTLLARQPDTLDLTSSATANGTRALSRGAPSPFLAEIEFAPVPVASARPDCGLTARQIDSKKPPCYTAQHRVGHSPVAFYFRNGWLFSPEYAFRLHDATHPGDADAPGLRLHPLKGGSGRRVERARLRQLACGVPIRGRRSRGRGLGGLPLTCRRSVT